MTKRCKICRVPLEGWSYKYIAHALFRVEPSKKKKGICNKCENKQ
ncbi:MAG TPA: hypothetical protein VJC00_03440 [Candidatus Nanoarchaeia archaeon]|nr:hypothetical protein [Candidatus Nanoarchaeia archaeon]